MACVERCVLLGSARIRPGGAGRECASKTPRPFLWRSQVRRLDPDERAHDRGLVADCLATRRPWTPCVLSARARPFFVLVAAGMSIAGKSMRVELLAACTDTAVAFGGATLAAPQRCRQCVPVSCSSNLARSLTGACAISPGTLFLHSLPHKGTSCHASLVAYLRVSCFVRPREI